MKNAERGAGGEMTWIVMRRLALAFCLCSYTIMGCAEEVQERPVKVVATFSILADLVQQVAGEHADVYSLVGWGEDAHVFHATPTAVRKVSEADLLVVNGLGFEGWIERLVASSGFTRKVLTAADGISVVIVGDEKDGDEERARDQVATDDHHHGKMDPHAWHSLSAVKIYVHNIAEALIKVDPKRRDAYQRNAANYLQQLDTLDAYIREQLQTIPANQRQIVVPHNAFAYLAREYALQIHSLQGISTESEASAWEVAKVIRLIREQHIHAVFSENVTNSRLITQVQAETQARFGGNLISDSLARAIAPTYVDMMTYNINTIVGTLKSASDQPPH